METVGWVAVSLAAIGGARVVVGHALDQIPPLSRKGITAARELHKLLEELRRIRGERKKRPPKGEDG